MSVLPVRRAIKRLWLIFNSTEKSSGQVRSSGLVCPWTFCMYSHWQAGLVLPGQAQCAEMRIRMEDMLRIGVVTTTHGIRGEVKVFPTTDDVRRYDKCDEVILLTKKGNLTLHVQSVKYFKNIVIVKFKEFDNINDVEGFRQCDLMVTRENALPLEEGSYYLCDVIGAKVQEEDGTLVGVVKDVIETGANPVFEIRTEEGRNVLFPVIPQCIKNVDVEKGVVTAHIMDGLMDL